MGLRIIDSYIIESNDTEDACEQLVSLLSTKILQTWKRANGACYEIVNHEDNVETIDMTVTAQFGDNMTVSIFEY